MYKLYTSIVSVYSVTNILILDDVTFFSRKNKREKKSWLSTVEMSAENAPYSHHKMKNIFLALIYKKQLLCRMMLYTRYIIIITAKLKMVYLLTAQYPALHQFEQQSLLTLH